MKLFCLLFSVLICLSANATSLLSSFEIMTEKENFLDDFDIHDHTLSFKKLGGTTSTNWMVKKDDIPVVNLKCSAGNTNHQAAIVVYELGKLLDFNIYPVAKEILIKSLRIKGKSYTRKCALKEWSSFFTQYFWTRETFSNSKKGSKKLIIDALNIKKSYKPESSVSFYAHSKFGSPSIKTPTTYIGYTKVENFAKDWSNMMVMDAIIGNIDRFPGGNTFFRSETAEANFFQKKNRIVFPNARVFSLDNEAALKSSAEKPLRDLKSYVSRFDKEFIERLKFLYERLSDEVFYRDHDFLSYRTQRNKELVRDFLSKNIYEVLSYIKMLENRYGMAIYL